MLPVVSEKILLPLTYSSSLRTVLRTDPFSPGIHLFSPWSSLFHFVLSFCQVAAHTHLNALSNHYFVIWPVGCSFSFANGASAFLTTADFVALQLPFPFR